MPLTPDQLRLQHHGQNVLVYADQVGRCACGGGCPTCARFFAGAAALRGELPKLQQENAALRAQVARLEAKAARPALPAVKPGPPKTGRLADVPKRALGLGGKAPEVTVIPWPKPPSLPKRRKGTGGSSSQVPGDVPYSPSTDMST